MSGKSLRKHRLAKASELFAVAAWCPVVSAVENGADAYPKFSRVT